MTPRAALALAVPAWVACILAAIVQVLGPVALPAIGLSISHPSRLWVAAAVLGAAAIWSARGPARLLDLLGRSSLPPTATALTAVTLFAVLLAATGAVSVGGADSAGYLAQARRWTTGTLREPIALAVPGLRDAAWRQSPLGFRPDPTETMTVPSYPPGLPIVEAAALIAGGETAAVRGVPLVSAIVALVTLFVLARAHSGPVGAAVAVVAFASLPTVLFQSLQPMSDVPALAAWLVALTLASRQGWAAALGTAGSTLVAIAIRPNLAPLVAVVAWQSVLGGAPVPDRRRRLTTLAIASALIVCAIATMQWGLYGSPLQSGYGSASELFSWRYVAANATLYPQWFRESTALPSTILLSAGSGALLAMAVRDARLRPLAGCAVLVAALYLVYVPFDSWTYLRFVLLALAMAAVGLAVLAQAVVDALGARWRFTAFAVVAALAALPNLAVAQRLGVFGVGAREFRYDVAASFIRDQVPPAAVVIAGQHSASVGYYSGRPVLRADLLDAMALSTIAAWAEAEQRPVAVVLDVDEAVAFRARTAGTAVGALDWPPRAEIGRPVTTRVWVTGDRAAYSAGQTVPTTRLGVSTR